MSVELKEDDIVSVKKTIKDALKAIRQDHPERKVTAEAVVESASHPDHALHRFFEWEDGIAAHQYRLEQARSLIRTIKVVSVSNGDRKVRIPEYVSLISDRKLPGGGYRATADVMTNKEMLTELEETAKRDVDGVLQRYEMLKDFCAKVREVVNINPATRSPVTRRRR